MNDKIQPVLKKLRQMYDPISTKTTDEFLTLRHNILTYIDNCLTLREMDLPKPKQTFKSRERQARFLADARLQPGFITVLDEKYIKVYSINNEYYLALSPLTWTSPDSSGRFD